MSQRQLPTPQPGPHRRPAPRPPRAGGTYDFPRMVVKVAIVLVWVGAAVLVLALMLGAASADLPKTPENPLHRDYAAEAVQRRASNAGAGVVFMVSVLTIVGAALAHASLATMLAIFDCAEDLRAQTRLLQQR